MISPQLHINFLSLVQQKKPITGLRMIIDELHESKQHHPKKNKKYHQ